MFLEPLMLKLRYDIRIETQKQGVTDLFSGELPTD